MAGMVSAALILGGTGLLGGLLDDSEQEAAEIRAGASIESSKISAEALIQSELIRAATTNQQGLLQALAALQAAGLSGRTSLPGQSEISEALSPYLWENIDIGLTEKEKTLFRGAGKTNILKSAKDTRGLMTKRAASQGLRGGSISNILSNIDESVLPSLAKVETNIAELDVARRQGRISDILTFLSLEGGQTPEQKQENISDIIENFIEQAEDLSLIPDEPVQPVTQPATNTINQPVINTVPDPYHYGDLVPDKWKDIPGILSP